MNIFLAPVLFAGVFAAYVMDDIDNGNVEMYSQVTHTGNVVFIGNRNGFSILVAAVKSKVNHLVVLLLIHRLVLLDLLEDVIHLTWLNLNVAKVFGASSAV